MDVEYITVLLSVGYIQFISWFYYTYGVLQSITSQKVYYILSRLLQYACYVIYISSKYVYMVVLLYIPIFIIEGKKSLDRKWIWLLSKRLFFQLSMQQQMNSISFI